MRGFLNRIGVSLPFLEIGKSIAVRILAEDVGVGDGQAVCVQPFIRNGRVHF